MAERPDSPESRGREVSEGIAAVKRGEDGDEDGDGQSKRGRRVGNVRVRLDAFFKGGNHHAHRIPGPAAYLGTLRGRLVQYAVSRRGWGLVAKLRQFLERRRHVRDGFLTQFEGGELVDHYSVQPNAPSRQQTLRSWKACALIFLFSSRRSTTSL